VRGALAAAALLGTRGALAGRTMRGADARGATADAAGGDGGEVCASDAAHTPPSATLPTTPRDSHRRTNIKRDMQFSAIIASDHAS
jgi:hypothetical protein